MADSVRVAVVGLGGIGLTHARALARLRREGLAVELVRYSGGTSGRIADAGWPQARAGGVEEVVSAPDVDVVAVCTPSTTHADLTLAALEAGKHVVVEKPMALRTADAQRIVDTAEARGLQVSPMAQRRFEPQHAYLKGLLDAGRLGRVVLGETFVHWHRDNAYYAARAWRSDPGGGSGSLMNQGLHNADLLCWLLGPVSGAGGLTATLGHDDLPVEDTCVATLRFASGALGVIVTTTATPPGEPAELAIRTTTGSVRLSQSGVVDWGFADVPPPPQPDEAVSGASDPAAIGIGGHMDQWRDVLDALRTRRPPGIGALDGLATTAVLAAIYDAADGAGWVDIETSGGGPP